MAYKNKKGQKTLPHSFTISVTARLTHDKSHEHAADTLSRVRPAPFLSFYCRFIPVAVLLGIITVIIPFPVPAPACAGNFFALFHSCSFAFCLFLKRYKYPFCVCSISCTCSAHKVPPAPAWFTSHGCFGGRNHSPAKVRRKKRVSPFRQSASAGKLFLICFAYILQTRSQAAHNRTL